MEQNTNTGVPITPVIDNKQKSGNGLKIATIAACVVAICGVGFGVYGMIDANSKNNIIATKNNEISDLTDQLNSLSAKIDELESKVNTQQNSKQDDLVVDDKNLTPGIENGVFVFKNSAGTIVMQDSEIKNISHIIACDGNITGKCTAKTSDGKSVWFVFDLNNKEIKSGYSTVDYGP